MIQTMNLKKVLFILILLIFFIQRNLGIEIYVSTKGNDYNTGSKNDPVRTLSMALRIARETRRLNPFLHDTIFIFVEKGYYFFEEPEMIRPEDSGTQFSPTVITSFKNDEVVFSGGVKIEKWHPLKNNVNGLKSEVKKYIWYAKIPEIGGRIFEFRQLWVNGKKAIRSREPDGETMERIISMDKTRESFIIPNTVPIPSNNFLPYEMIIHQRWAIAILRVKDIRKLKDNNLEIFFHQPESKIEFEHPWPQPVVNEKAGNSAFYLANAIEFLDQPGEWFADFKNGYIYYYPRNDENMQTAEVYVPYNERILTIEGYVDHPVSNIIFKNITFQYTTWLRPSLKGHVPLQAGFYILDAYKLKIPGTKDKASLENQAWIGRQPAAVEVNFAHNITFEYCVFRNLGATGLDFISGVKYSMVKGCVFYDIAGTALQMGTFPDRGFETHVPYDPKDKREICSYININNNYIYNCANEDWGCVGISAGYVSDVKIEHNEVSHIYYSGICVGWGWTKTVNCMKNNIIYANHIHHFAKQMYDVGGIYTLSAQPGTKILENCIEFLEKAPYAHDPDHCFYIYLDEGSSYIRVENNYAPEKKFFANSNGPGVEWINNGPEVDIKIKENAGILEKYNFIKNRVKY